MKNIFLADIGFKVGLIVVFIIGVFCGHNLGVNETKNTFFMKCSRTNDSVPSDISNEICSDLVNKFFD